MRLTDQEFEDLVVQALDSLPEDLLEMMDNVDITIERFPTRAQMHSAGIRGGTLLGLYEGIPLTERGGAYNMILPDKITLFQRSLEAVCPDDETLRREVQVTVVHEIAHHFGISDRRLAELGWA